MVAKLRVHLIHLGRNGAGPAILEELIKAHMRLGIQVDATWSSYAENAAELVRSCPEGASLTTYRSRSGFILAFPRMLTAAWRISRRAQISKTDYVLSSMGSPWQWIFAAAFRMRGVPYYAAIHDVVLHSGESSKLLDLYRSLEPLISSGLVFFSEFSRKEARSAGWLYRQKSVVIPHGLLAAPRGNGTSQPGGSPRGELKIGVIGRLVRYKGLDKLPGVISVIRESKPEAVVEVWGDGDRSLIDGFAKNDGIHLNIGWIPETKISAIVRSMDVILLPYDEATQSGLVPLAQFNGVPVIVSPVGALPEQVEFGALGYVASSNTSEALAEAVLRATESSNSRQVVEEAKSSVAPGGRRSWESAALEVSKFALRGMKASGGE